jgi:hypothetical protein
MPVTNEKYDQLKIDKLKYYLEEMASKGQAKPFEIFVDSLKVVPKTEDPKDFDSYEYYMNEDTEKVRILIYNSNLSPRNDQYCFYVQQGKTEKGLNGLGEVEQIVQDKLAARDREYETNRLKEDLEKTKKSLDEAEEYIDELETKLELSSTEKYKLRGFNMLDFGVAVAEKLAEKHADKLGALGLGGFTPTKELPLAETTEASFQKKDPANAPNEKQQQYIEFMTELEKTFDEQQMLSVIQILQQLMEAPQQVETVLSLLTKQ